MGVQYDVIENVIEIEESCSVEDSETLLQLVLEHDDALIDASRVYIQARRKPPQPKPHQTHAMAAPKESEKNAYGRIVTQSSER